MAKTNYRKERRTNFMRKMEKDSIALIPSAPKCVRNKDVEYPYRQDSDFFYLTGFGEPHAVAVFIPADDRKKGKFILFCSPADPEEATWVGKNAGLDGATEMYGADESFPIDEFEKRLPDLLENRKRIYYPFDSKLPKKVAAAVLKLREKVRAGAVAPSEFVEIEHILHKMRMIKTPRELAHIRHTINVSVKAHIRAMKFCRPGMFEYQIEAELLHEFMKNGLRNVAYPSIVAGGKNACILHYTDNCDALHDGDLLLIDAGAESPEHWAADITRTFPVNGRFTEPQKLLYQLVLDAQLAVIALVYPGTSWDLLLDTAVRLITEGLVKLGLLEGDVDELIKNETYKKFYMHRIGHWLGLDVHDVGDYKVNGKWRILRTGMVLTVEPGIYVQPDDMSVDEKWRGIGIRIEDDILVTKDGCEVLSAAAPKTIEAIEHLMKT
jgi:Xaa-Pro aminopeptidase